MPKIVVTRAEYDKGRDIFDNTSGFECVPSEPDEESLAAVICEHSVRYAVVGINKYTGKLYESLPENGLIARFGVGHDGIDKKLAKSLKIYCTNTPGVLDESVAECAAGMLLAVARNLCSSAADNRNGIWNPRAGCELYGKNLAIIGCGNIGRKLAAIAANGLGMRVYGNDIAKPQDLGSIHFFTHDYEEAVSGADFVSLHIPDTSATRNFMNRQRIAALKPSAIIINTSRGGVLDENALFDALSSGQLVGAGLDVFKSEPYVPANERKDLRTLDNVLMTPHIGSNTAEACRRMAKAVLRNIMNCESGNFSQMDMLY